VSAQIEVYVRVWVKEGKDPAAVQTKLTQLFGSLYIGSATLTHRPGTADRDHCHIVIGIRGPEDEVKRKLGDLRRHEDVKDRQELKRRDGPTGHAGSP
jgi:hypothetical protein